MADPAAVARTHTRAEGVTAPHAALTHSALSCLFSSVVQSVGSLLLKQGVFEGQKLLGGTWTPRRTTWGADHPRLSGSLDMPPV